MISRAWRCSATRRSSRPTTSAASTARRSTPSTALTIGRAFARVIAELEGKPTGELRLGLGRDMRLTAPELAAAYRDGMCAEGATVLDAGLVGTEMLYYLVGSRDLDGGLMCTASHNPKGYTGAKLVGRGALALSGDAGIGDMRDRIAAGLGDAARAAAASRRSRSTTSSTQAALRFIDPAAVKPLKVVVDGGNGMAGPMVGPLLERLGLDLIDDLLDARRQLPRPRAQPAAAREPRVHHARGRRASGADLGIAWDGDADRCFFIDETGRVRRRRLPHRAARRVDARQAARRDDPLRRPRQPRGRRHGRARRAAGADQPRRPRVLQDADARRSARCSAARSRGHYYFRDFYCADSGTLPALLILELLSQRGATHVRAARAVPLASTSSPARSTPRSPTRRAKIEESPSATRDAAPDPPRRDLGRLRRLALQRAPSNTEPLLRLCLESLRSREDMERRRDEVLGRDPLVSARDRRPPRRRSATRRARRRAAPGSTALAIPTPFLVGRVNCYLIEDDPLTLVDTGPNSGKSLDELERGAGRARPLDRGPRADRAHPPAHGPPRAARDPRAPLGRRGRGARPLAPYLADFSASAAADDEFAQARDAPPRHPPDDLATVLGAVGAAFRAFGSRGAVTRPLRDGDELTLRDRTLPVLHRPGHSPSDTSSGRAERRMLIARRPPARPHLLQPAGLAAAGPADEAGDGGPTPAALIDYIDSMRATRELPAAGRARRATASRSLDHAGADRRAAAACTSGAPGKMLRMLDRRAAAPPTRSRSQMWGNVAVTQAYLTLSEVLGHLDLLVARRAVRERRGRRAVPLRGGALSARARRSGIRGGRPACSGDTVVVGALGTRRRGSTPSASACRRAGSPAGR